MHCSASVARGCPRGGSSRTVALLDVGWCSAFSPSLRRRWAFGLSLDVHPKQYGCGVSVRRRRGGKHVRTSVCIPRGRWRAGACTDGFSCSPRGPCVYTRAVGYRDGSARKRTTFTGSMASNAEGLVLGRCRWISVRWRWPMRLPFLRKMRILSEHN